MYSRLSPCHTGNVSFIDVQQICVILGFGFCNNSDTNSFNTFGFKGVDQMDLFGDMSTPPDVSSPTVSGLQLTYVTSTFESKLCLSSKIYFVLVLQKPLPSYSNILET